MKKNYKGFTPTLLTNMPTDEGKSIEEMIRHATANNEPIEGSAPMIYTEKADEVLPEFDIRTDRQELAIEATDKFSSSERAKSKGISEQEAPEQPSKETTELEF